MSTARARHEVSEDGAVQTITLDEPPGNVIDIAMCAELEAVLESAAAAPEARVLVVAGAGDNFSFGASVEEHLPDKAREMLTALGGVLRTLVGFPYPTLAAVRGRCLGGGLELALACGLIIAEEDAVLGSPEIRLGVLAPAATALLTGRVAEDVLLTGRDLSAVEAQRLGIVNAIAAEAGLSETVADYVDQFFRPRSAASLRSATKAIRSSRVAAFEERLAEAERIYTEELLALHDGTEGIRAFIEKRPPVWRNA